MSASVCACDCCVRTVDGLFHIRLRAAQAILEHENGPPWEEVPVFADGAGLF